MDTRQPVSLTHQSTPTEYPPMFLSVIIPVFNTEPTYLEECLNSTIKLKNTCPYELIVIDDGSTDGRTLDFLSRLHLRYSDTDLHLVRQENKGLAAARNSGIRQASGQFILPLDSDDILGDDIPYFVEYLTNHPETEILYGDYSTFGDETKTFRLKPFLPAEILLLRNKLTACAFFQKVVWQRLNGYDEDFGSLEDYEFWCRCVLNDIQFTHLPRINFYYRKIYDGRSLLQKTRASHLAYHQKIIDKNLNSHINIKELHACINQELRTQLCKKRRKAIAIFLYTFTPKLYYWLCGKRLFSYKDHFIQF